MLAIDRLKKLKLAAKRSAQQNAELFQALSAPAEQSPGMFDSHPSPSVMYHSQSKPCIRPQMSPSCFLAANNDIYGRSCEPLYAAQPRSLAAYQPELVAIQVRRSTGVQSSAVYDVPVVSPAGYGSFHGVPVRDASVGRVVSPYDDTGVVCMCRTSDDSYASTPCSAIPYSMMTPMTRVSTGSPHLPAMRASAPSTPLPTTSRLTPSTPKKTPPVPPQRTNSVKVCSSQVVADTDSQLMSSQTRTVNYGSLDRISKQSVQTVHNVVPCSGSTSTPESSVSATVETGSTGDCSTLPFANENVGTIRQRGSANSASAARAVNDNNDDDTAFYDEYSGTVRRRGRHLFVC